MSGREVDKGVTMKSRDKLEMGITVPQAHMLKNTLWPLRIARSIPRPGASPVGVAREHIHVCRVPTLP